MNEEGKKIISNLRHIAVSRGVTQEEIAQATGLKQQAVSAVFSGKRDARISTIALIAAALDSDVVIKAKCDRLSGEQLRKEL